MSKKAFGIYTSGGNDAIKNNDLLIIEIGYSHLACLIKGSDNSVAAFELYTFNKNETSDFENLFSSVLDKSQLLDKTYADTKLYINHEFALPVPATKFNEEISNDYLNVVFGEDEDSILQFDEVNAEPGLMNVFRISSKWLNVVNQRFKKVSVQHSYTSIIRIAITTASGASVIKIQFYPAHIIAILMQEGALQFIQSFLYQSAEDVLYYLLSISQRLNVNTPDLTIYASGMIDLQSAMYLQLAKYFRHIVFEDADKSQLSIDISGHPPHYFTPFFNLAP